ncbi:MAG: HAMP domain-containing sensor histidine kinase, partial [bacterium]|nr:HAMP domain-containing sensor histidine kinase [bacterium]
RQGGEYLLTLVDDILDLTSIEAGNLQVQVSAVDVAQVVDSACDTVGSILKPGVELFHEVLPNTGPVRTDRARLRQILVNLLGYSAKHTSKGRIEVHADLQGEDLRITVKDSGPGISKEHLTALFADFRQVEGSGIAHRDTGLGMSVAKRLAELLGGGIAVTSEEGKGSIFTIRVLATYGQEGNA